MEKSVACGASRRTLVHDTPRPRSSFHSAEMDLCTAHASSVASAVGGSLSRGCVFATLYVSEEAAAAAAAQSQTLTLTHTSAKAKGGGATAKGGWLQAMVDECRVSMENRFPCERAEATAEAAGRSGGGGGGGGDGMGDEEDSAEEGWTSDLEELAKEAARKVVSNEAEP